jgi:membrane peptidoglycan carboxypeptidase
MAVGISPTYYDPIKNPGRALQKRNEILQMAVFKNILTPEEGEAEKNSPLGLLE